MASVMEPVFEQASVPSHDSDEKRDRHDGGLGRKILFRQNQQDGT